MKKFISGVFLFLLFFTFSCQDGKMTSEFIKFNLDDKSSNSLLIKMLAIVPLETNENCLIGSISNLKYFNNQFYLHDFLSGHALYLFSDSGKFVNRTAIGKGPGELISPIAFTISQEDSVIFIQDDIKQSLSIFDRHLNYIRSIKFENNFVLNLFSLNRDSFLIFQNKLVSQPNTNNQHYNYSLFTKNFTKGEYLDLLSSNNKTALKLSNSVSIVNKKVLLIAPYNYNIYELDGNKTNIRYQLDFGKYSLSPEELEKLSSKEIIQLANTGKRIGGILNIFKNKDFLVIRPSFTRVPKYLLRSEASRKTYLLNETYGSVLPECKIWGTNNDGNFYATVEPDKFIDFQKLSGQFKEFKITLNDNPIVIIFKVEEKTIN